KLASDSNKYLLEVYMEEFLALKLDTPLNQAFNNWLENKDDVKGSKEATAEILNLKDEKVTDEKGNELIEKIFDLKDYLIKKSVWIFGGDGWSYDIGYGGVDHVLASGEDINILVFDTEVYSNTGGQASKATMTGATAQRSEERRVGKESRMTRGPRACSEMEEGLVDDRQSEVGS